MAINVEVGVKKRMRLNCQCINQIRVSGNDSVKSALARKRNRKKRNRESALEETR